MKFFRASNELYVFSRLFWYFINEWVFFSCVHSVRCSFSTFQEVLQATRSTFFLHFFFIFSPSVAFHSTFYSFFDSLVWPFAWSLAYFCAYYTFFIQLLPLLFFCVCFSSLRFILPCSVYLLVRTYRIVLYALLMLFIALLSVNVCHVVSAAAT